MIWVFWLAVAALFYSIVGYGLLVIILARLAPSRPPRPPQQPLLFSFLVAAHDEAAHIEAKIRNALAQDSGPHRIEVIVVSDGSSDGTPDLARQVEDPRVQVIELQAHAGKATAINLGLERCQGDVVVFSDANSLLRQGSLLALARHFGDPNVGGVCGRITVDSKRRGPTAQAEGLYWRYDQAIKAAESRLGGAVSAQGSIYAIRRELTAPLVLGCADDFLMSVRVVAAGTRLAFEPDAVTSEPVSEKVGREMGRRVRSTERGWRALMLMKGLMNPFKHRLYAWQLFSHKFLRRLNPVLFLLIFASNLFILSEGRIYQVTALAQIAFYGIGLLAMAFPQLRRFKPASIAAFVIFTNAAMLQGILRYYRGHKSVIWRPVRE